ncbi:MAG: lyase family protein, partial [Gemmatimonadaceae bacterium]
MTTPAEVADWLRSTSFLNGFLETHLWKLARHMTPLELTPDYLLFQEGHARERFAILISGAIAVEKESEGRHSRLATFGPGDAVGEGLLLDDAPHGTTARAIMPGTAMVMTRSQLDDIMKDSPQLYAALVARAARSISERLRRADATLVGRGRTLGFGGHRTRTEHDLLGDREVPYEALYGVQTLRALENFPITGEPLREFPELIEAIACVKEAAALANHELKLLDTERMDVIVKAAREIRAGRHHEHFLVDMIQGGAGTSTNMNANEVIANRALELLNRPRGDYEMISPNSHVNLSQSTNDVYPTAVRLALHSSIEGFRKELAMLVKAFALKGAEFAPMLKMGRTQMQDAVPMTLGQ